MQHAKAVAIGIVCVVLVAGAFAVWKSHAPGPSIDENAALAQLQSDMQNIEPHFVDARLQTQQTLSPAGQKIKGDVAELYSARYTALEPAGIVISAEDLLRSDLWLSAIGKRYVLVTEAGAENIQDEILDSQTGKVSYIQSLDMYDLVPNRELVLYIDSQALYTYSLDQATTTLVAGSQLSGSETYHDGVEEILDHAQQTHTADSITISVFDSSRRISNPDVGNMYAKVGQKTLAF